MPGVQSLAKYGGVAVYLPVVSRFRPGDILLTLNTESDDRKELRVSRVIARATRGRFSHALICSIPPTFIEAIGPGVSTISLARCFAHNLKNVRALRYPDREVSAKAASLARLEVGRDYSRAKAIASVFPQQIIAKIAVHGTFCSALVAQVFTAAGASAFSSLAVDKTTPATIDEMDCLEDITSDVFRPALAPNNIESLSALDVLSPSARQTEINNRYAKALMPTISRIIAAYPEIGLDAPITFFQIIQFIMDAMDASLTVDLAKRSAFKAAVATLDEQAAALFGAGEQLDLLLEIIELDDAQLQRNLDESFKADPDIDISAMRSYLVTSINQLQERRAAVQPFIEWGIKRSRVLAHYIALQEHTFEPIERRVSLLKEILGRVG